MTTAAVNGISMGYDDTGSAPPLVLVHGHPFDRTMWAPQLAEFGATHRVIAADLRGFGHSSYALADWGGFATDIAGLLDHLGIDDVVLGGLSMGGQIVLDFYQRFPARVRGLLIADSFARTDSDEGKKWRYDLADRLEREGMGPYATEGLTKKVAPCN